MNDFTPKYPKEVIDRFWSKVDRRGQNECWNWKAGLLIRGYGHFFFNYQDIRAHRFAYEITFGEIKEGMHICHKCDNPGCVNPDHLFAGSGADNTHDMLQKNRQHFVRGENHGLAKLTENKVHEIRAAYTKGDISQRALASQYNVSLREIWHVIHKHTWKHVE